MITSIIRLFLNLIVGLYLAGNEESVILPWALSAISPVLGVHYVNTVYILKLLLVLAIE